MQFITATRANAKARIALIGTFGSGKTYSALRIAAGLGCQRIGLIDSERGKSRKQSGKGVEFGLLVLQNHSPRTYIEALETAARAGIDGIIIDSLSHEWIGEGGALAMVASAARESESGNEFAAWRDVSPEHARLFDAILAYPGHVLGTMRTRKAYEMVEEVNRYGKKVTKPRAAGLEPIQREDFEYEFDIVGYLDGEHCLRVTKSCCELLPKGAVIKQPGAEVGERIAAWLRGGGRSADAAAAPSSSADSAAAAS